MKISPPLCEPQVMRENYIKKLNEASNPTQKAKEIAEDLFALDLTVYSSNYTFDSLVYSAMSRSQLDNNISLHPEQIRIIDEIHNNATLIVSAPTSFGKTFCVFEYISRYSPNNIVLIVPTLALVDEYLKKIIKKYKDFFGQYKIHTTINDENSYDFKCKNIFILTHDRIVQENAYTLIESVDFLVIDEVYKLETDKSNDRVLVLNMAYYYLAQKALKYVLLAPFINSIEDIESLEKKPVFYNTMYSPVVNDVKVKKILRHEDRYQECQNLLKEIDCNDKTLIFFPTVVGIYNYVNNFIINEPCIEELDVATQNFLLWAKEEIHEAWCVIKAMERGYLIHNGQIPMGTRMFQLDNYEKEGAFNRLLCTSTLLEGVNTTAKNIIITKPSRMSERNNNDADFSAFDFFNLVGRTGRLNQHYVGNAYYLKAPSDPDYNKIDAIRSVKFEITDESKDVDIQKGNIEHHEDVIKFLKELGITIEEYQKNIGSRPRFETVKEIYSRYKTNYSKLVLELQKFIDNPQNGRLHLVSALYQIVENRPNPMNCNIINKLLNMNRLKIKTVVDEIHKFYTTTNIDTIISTTIRMKSSYIEHIFYPKVQLIIYFMNLSKIDKNLVDIINKKIIEPIDFLYFASSKQRKMLVDLGIYERDVENIVKIIGDDYEDAFELKRRLQESWDKMKNISFISKYVIQNLI